MEEKMPLKRIWLITHTYTMHYYSKWNGWYESGGVKTSTRLIEIHPAKWLAQERQRHSERHRSAEGESMQVGEILMAIPVVPNDLLTTNDKRWIGGLKGLDGYTRV